jgi:hypothetical protein
MRCYAARSCLLIHPSPGTRTPLVFGEGAQSRASFPVEVAGRVGKDVHHHEVELVFRSRSFYLLLDALRSLDESFLSFIRTGEVVLHVGLALGLTTLPLFFRDAAFQCAVRVARGDVPPFRRRDEAHQSALAASKVPFLGVR